MNPLAALISGGLSMFGGIFGANKQAEQNEYMASGGYLPDLIKNAQSAGINPLAVIGKSTQAGGVGAPITEGVSQAARAVSAIDVKKHELELDRAGQEIKNLEAQNDNTRIQTAVQQEALDRLQRYPDYMPGSLQYPPERTSIPGMITDPKIQFPNLLPKMPDVPTIPWAEWFRRLKPSWGGGSVEPGDPYGNPFF